MKRHVKPRWNTLFIVGLIMGAALLPEARLPLSPDGHSWLLGLWVLVFYGAVSVWLTANREALKAAPRPRDVVGRLIIDVDAPDLVEIEEKKMRKDTRPLAVPFPQSEAI